MKPKRLWPGLIAAVLAVLITSSYFVAGTVSQASAADAVNLVKNPSLELGAGDPTCFSRSGWGTEGDWTFPAGRAGGRAASGAIQSYSQGDRKLLQTETADCAPAVTAGLTYALQIWYKSTASVSLTMFRHTAQGWSYWGDPKQEAAASDWTLAEATLPVIPEGTDQVTFGLSLGANGTLITDDYSMTEISVPPLSGTGELIVNGDLVAGTNVPTCFMIAGWGNRQVNSSLSTDIPANSAAGTRSFDLNISSYVSGDAKLIQSDAAGCAPAVLPGSQYDLRIDYKTTAAGSSGLTAVPPSLSQHLQEMTDAGMDPASMPHSWACGGGP